LQRVVKGEGGRIVNFGGAIDKKVWKLRIFGEARWRWKPATY
jgi:hypothetical protein